MSDTIEVRYVGPLTEGVTLVPSAGPYAGREYLCPHGEWVTLPTDIVNGTAHRFVDGYKVPDDPAAVESEAIVEHGLAPLAAQEWETRETKKKNAAAPTTEGL